MSSCRFRTVTVRAAQLLYVSTRTCNLRCMIFTRHRHHCVRPTRRSPISYGHVYTNHHHHIAINCHTCTARNSAAKHAMELIMDASCATDDDDDADAIMRILCALARHIHPIRTVLLTTNVFCNMFAPRRRTYPRRCNAHTDDRTTCRYVCSAMAVDAR